MIAKFTIVRQWLSSYQFFKIRNTCMRYKITFLSFGSLEIFTLDFCIYLNILYWLKGGRDMFLTKIWNPPFRRAKMPRNAEKWRFLKVNQELSTAVFSYFTYVSKTHLLIIIGQDTHKCGPLHYTQGDKNHHFTGTRKNDTTASLTLPTSPKIFTTTKPNPLQHTHKYIIVP